MVHHQRAERRRLTARDHSRDSAGLTYVYPVWSRRSGGLSVGINLNPNNACNWRCIYCQVPDLARGTAPPIDMEKLEMELNGFLADVLQGDFYERFEVPEGQRRLRDIAISGNGEATSARQFDRIVNRIGGLVRRYQLVDRIGLVLISNGSLIHRQGVQRGLERLADLGGELWFKLDRATGRGLSEVNHAALSLDRVRRNLEMAAKLCPTWLQTCCFALDGEPWPADEETAYLNFLAGLVECGIPLRGVMLYGLARPSMQPESGRLSRLPAEALDKLADRLRRLGLVVRVNP